MVDAIDYAGFDYKVMFARIAREMGVLNVTAPLPGFGTLMAIFAPRGMTVEEFYQAPADPALWPDYKIPLDRILGESRFGHIVRRLRAGECGYLSTCAGASALNGGLVATEIALILTGLRQRQDVVVAPRVTYVDVLRRIFEVYEVTGA